MEQTYGKMRSAHLRERLGNVLRKWPWLYRLVTKIFLAVRPARVMELLIGTRVREKQWEQRHLRKGNDWNNTTHVDDENEWVLAYWESQSHSHRSFLVERISSYSPISSILEIGSNCGPNLRLLAQRFPDAKIQGIDVNPKAIEMGNKLFAAEGISNVVLSVGKADELAQFQDKSFDIVFTDAVLIYVGKDKIERVIREMLRVARRALVLVERVSSGEKANALGVLQGHPPTDYWERDYVALVNRFVPEARISVTKINSDLWPDKRWAETGFVIEVII